MYYCVTSMKKKSCYIKDQRMNPIGFVVGNLESTVRVLLECDCNTIRLILMISTIYDLVMCFHWKDALGRSGLGTTRWDTGDININERAKFNTGYTVKLNEFL